MAMQDDMNRRFKSKSNKKDKKDSESDNDNTMISINSLIKQAKIAG